MKYTVSTSLIDVVGTIWQPGVGPCAQTIKLSDYDLENARDDDGNLTRDSIQGWLDTNAGDFQSIDDFQASLKDNGKTIEIPWASEDSEMTFVDCMLFPQELSELGQ